MVMHKSFNELCNVDVLSRLRRATNETVIPEPGDICLMSGQLEFLVTAREIGKATKDDQLLLKVQHAILRVWNLQIPEKITTFSMRKIIPKVLQYHSEHESVTRMKMIERSYFC